MIKMIGKEKRKYYSCIWETEEPTVFFCFSFFDTAQTSKNSKEWERNERGGKWQKVVTVHSSNSHSSNSHSRNVRVKYEVPDGKKVNRKWTDLSTQSTAVTWFLFWLTNVTKTEGEREKTSIALCRRISSIYPFHSLLLSKWSFLYRMSLPPSS